MTTNATKCPEYRYVRVENNCTSRTLGIPVSPHLSELSYHLAIPPISIDSLWSVEAHTCRSRNGSNVRPIVVD